MYLSILFLQHTPADCPGCFWSWFLWMLAAFALGLGIGKWIWGKYALLVKTKNKKLKEFKNKNEALEKDLVALKYQFNESEKDNKGLKASLADSAANIMVLGTQLSRLRQEKSIGKTEDKFHKEEKATSISPTTPVKEVPIEEIPKEKFKEEKASTEKETISEPTTNITRKPIIKQEYRTPLKSTNSLDYSPYIKNNNLKVIEGVGPKIEGILNKSGYVTWQDLANADPNTLQNIMHDAGPRYRIHNPRTWQAQIQFCLDKNWKGLIDFQQKLYAEKTNQDFSNILTKVEKILAKKLGFTDIAIDDLKIVEGIGPQIENLLKAGHIKNWEDLAEAPLERIEKLLEDGGERFKLARPSSWSSQVQYALQQDWIKLKKYQEELMNG